MNKVTIDLDVLYDTLPIPINRKAFENYIKKCKIKPEQKIIDLTSLVDSNIDMQFCSNPDNLPWVVGLLTSIEENSTVRYTRDNSRGWFECCRIRENHWHHWTGDEYPLPDGLKCDVELRNGGRILHGGDFSRVRWEHRGEANSLEVIAFRITGKQKGALYEWEE